jgi:hypothetical protein
MQTLPPDDFADDHISYYHLWVVIYTLLMPYGREKFRKVRQFYESPNMKIDWEKFGMGEN